MGLRGFYQHLRSTIERAETFRAAIAYWTIRPDFVSLRLPELLGKSKIAILGAYRNDFADVKTVNKKLYLSVMDSTTGIEYVYQAEVGTASDNSANIQALSTGLDTPGQRYLLKTNHGFPKLEISSSKFDRSILSSIEYYVTVHTHEQLDVQVLEPLKVEKRWVVEGQGNFWNRLLDRPESDSMGNTAIKIPRFEK